MYAAALWICHPCHPFHPRSTLNRTMPILSMAVQMSTFKLTIDHRYIYISACTHTYPFGVHLASSKIFSAALIQPLVKRPVAISPALQFFPGLDLGFARHRFAKLFFLFGNEAVHFGLVPCLVLLLPLEERSTGPRLQYNHTRKSIARHG